MLALFLLLLSSCSSYLSSLEKEQHVDVVPPVSKATYCKKGEKDIFLSQSFEVAESFSRYMESVKPSFIELVVLWNLLHLNLRPDYIIPRSRLQVALFYRGENYYFDFTDRYLGRKGLHNTYLSGLAYLLAKFKARRNLIQLANILDRWEVNSFPIGEELASFVAKNKKSLKSYKIYDRIFFREGETLLAGESIPKLNFKNAVSSFQISSFDF